MPVSATEYAAPVGLDTEGIEDIASSLSGTEPALCWSRKQTHAAARVHAYVAAPADLFRQQHRLVESSPLQTSGMQRYGDQQFWMQTAFIVALESLAQ